MIHVETAVQNLCGWSCFISGSQTRHTRVRSMSRLRRLSDSLAARDDGQSVRWASSQDVHRHKLQVSDSNLHFALRCVLCRSCDGQWRGSGSSDRNFCPGIPPPLTHPSGNRRPARVRKAFLILVRLVVGQTTGKAKTMLHTGSLLFAAGFLTCAMVVASAIVWSFSDNRVTDGEFAQGDARRTA